MPRPSLVAIGSILLAAAACQAHDLSAPGGDHMPQPSFSASLDCRYSPSGAVEIAVGQSKRFSRSAGNCTGAYGTLSPADGRVSFGNSAPCATFAGPAAGTFDNAFKIVRCATGNATFAIYTNSSKTTILQTITILYN
jgi:hypothetical protein